MTILEAGIIAGAPAGAFVGGALGRSHGLLAASASAIGGLAAGAAAGWLFAVSLICLLSLIAVLWRAVRRRPNDPLGETDIERMTPVAIAGVFASAAAVAAALMASGWPRALVVLAASALLTAFLSVAKCELRRPE